MIFPLMGTAAAGPGPWEAAPVFDGAPSLAGEAKTEWPNARNSRAADRRKRVLFMIYPFTQWWV